MDYAMLGDQPEPSEPQSFKEYEARFARNQRITGYGIDAVKFHSPCPFCAAADYAEWLVIKAEESMQVDRTCRECGRSGKIIFLVNTSDEQRFEFVQTGGPLAPLWLVPAPRRVDGVHA